MEGSRLIAPVVIGQVRLWKNDRVIAYSPAFISLKPVVKKRAGMAGSSAAEGAPRTISPADRAIEKEMIPLKKYIAPLLWTLRDLRGSYAARAIKEDVIAHFRIRIAHEQAGRADRVHDVLEPIAFDE